MCLSGTDGQLDRLQKTTIVFNINYNFAGYLQKITYILLFVRAVP